jgi:hypothetical protein
MGMISPKAAPDRGNSHGRVGEDREEMQDGRRPRQQEDDGKLAGEGADQPEKHPAGAIVMWTDARRNDDPTQPSPMHLASI